MKEIIFLRNIEFNEQGTVEGAAMANLPLIKDQVALRGSLRVLTVANPGSLDA
uniref:Uncharacterized protein n=1 Tax=Candidatus Kentrum sp. FW TaxID=2126338 RepID=A0A450SZJ1_9GAMM|nr:MAG: hypothetical protein BECKFW1821B_GA0114236_10494 [Candidatus Kentron sp. FW]